MVKNRAVRGQSNVATRATSAVKERPTIEELVNLIANKTKEVGHEASEARGYVEGSLYAERGNIDETGGLVGDLAIILAELECIFEDVRALHKTLRKPKQGQSEHAPKKASRR